LDQLTKRQIGMRLVPFGSRGSQTTRPLTRARYRKTYSRQVGQDFTAQPIGNDDRGHPKLTKADAITKCGTDVRKHLEQPSSLRW
jgi:hypothetical protein